MHYAAVAFVLALAAGCQGASSLSPSSSPPPSPSPSPAPSPSSQVPPQPPGVAVVELFTSEGCSSCPSADVVLNEIAGEADPRVLTLAFHVDYWDSLGWRDRFARAEFTARQRTYAASLGESGVFTPQMIVNGTESFTGSDRSRARAAIARALATPSRARLTLTPAPHAGRASSVDVGFRVEGAVGAGPPAEATLDVALVEDGLSSKVQAGENEGRTLRHDGVVRAWASRAVGPAEGTLTLSPETTDRAEPRVAWPRATVVGFLTLRDGRTVIAGARARLVP